MRRGKSYGNSLQTGWIGALAALLALCAVTAHAQSGAGNGGGKPVASSKNGKQSTQGSGAQDQVQMVRRLLELNSADWQVAFTVGDEIASDDPDAGYRALAEAWPKLTSIEARQQLLKAFYYALPFPLHLREHPHLLEALNLGATDPEPKVRSYAFAYLREIALHDYANEPDAYRAWFAKNGHRPVQAVIADSVQETFTALIETKGAERDKIAQGFNELRLDSGAKPHLDPALRARVRDVAARWLAEPAISEAVAKAALTAIQLAEPDEAYLRHVVLPLLSSPHPTSVCAAAIQCLADPQYQWTTQPLLEALKRAVLADEPDAGTSSMIWSIAMALGRRNDAAVIPTLIGLIDYDNDYVTVYGIGGFALHPLTGVHYNEAHRGAWWRRWWNENRNRFPAPVCNMTVPNYAPKDDPAVIKAQQADPRVKWLQDHAVPIRTIDPDDDDFADLMPLMKQIGDARIVQLGEESHGDGATFMAKCRLVRFLHEKMGFDVLAWESGLFDCDRMERALHGTGTTCSAIDQGIFPIWGASAHVWPVFDYARSTYATPHPLEMAGVDLQYSSNHSQENFQAALRSYVGDKAVQQTLAATLAAKGQSVDELTDLLTRRDASTPEASKKLAEAVQTLDAAIQRNESALTRTHELREIALFRRWLANLPAQETPTDTEPNASAPESNNARDRMMADNLLWLARDYYPHSKIIVWAASLHIMHNASQIDAGKAGLSYEKLVPMGQTVWNELKERVYTVGFTAFQGQTGNPFFGAHHLKRADNGTLEALCHATERRTLCIDFRSLPADSWLRQPLEARPLGYASMRAVWPNVFDAMIFTDAMFPSARDGRLPAGVKTKAPALLPWQAETAQALNEFRNVAAGYSLNMDEVHADQPSGYDVGRLRDLMRPEDWPNMLTSQPLTARAQLLQLSGDAKGYDPTLAATISVGSPLTASLTPQTHEQTLVLMRGMASSGGIHMEQTGNLICMGDLGGMVQVHNYTTALIQGDLTGSFQATACYSLTVVKGRLTGRFATDCAGILYVLGGFTGEITLKENQLNGGAFKVVLMGRTTKAALGRIHGTGRIWLEESDMAPGVHTIGQLNVIVMGKLQPRPASRMSQ
jgi:erythromycin esterase